LVIALVAGPAMGGTGCREGRMPAHGPGSTLQAAGAPDAKQARHWVLRAAMVDAAARAREVAVAEQQWRWLERGLVALEWAGFNVSFLIRFPNSPGAHDDPTRLSDAAFKKMFDYQVKLYRGKFFVRGNGIPRDPRFRRLVPTCRCTSGCR
jgi:hypothetical protein